MKIWLLCILTSVGVNSSCSFEIYPFDFFTKLKTMFHTKLTKQTFNNSLCNTAMVCNFGVIISNLPKNLSLQRCVNVLTNVKYYFPLKIQKLFPFSASQVAKTWSTMQIKFQFILIHLPTGGASLKSRFQSLWKGIVLYDKNPSVPACSSCLYRNSLCRLQ